MATYITIKAEHADAVDIKASEFKARMKNFKPAWKYVRAYIYQMVREQFESQGARGGKQWEPLSPAYGRWKALHHPGKPILELSGKLKAAGVGTGPNATKDIQALSLTVGIKNKIALYHQRGTVKMPARPIYQHTQFDVEFIASLIVDHLLKNDAIY